MKVTMTQTVLHPMETDPDERRQLAERRGVDPEAIDISEVNTYAVRFEEGETYDVDSSVGGLFRSQGWATAAPQNFAGKNLAKPKDVRELSDEEAEEWAAGNEERFRAALSRQAGGGPEPDLDVQNSDSGQGSEF